MTTTIDIDAIRQRVERYSQSAIGSGKTIQAIQLANEDVPALLAKVDELTAERDAEHADAEHLREALRDNDNCYDGLLKDLGRLLSERDATNAALAQSREQAATYANEIGSLKAELEHLREQVFAQKPVVKAAEAWAEAWEELKGDDTVPYVIAQPSAALHDAIEQHRLMDMALTSARAEHAEATR